MTCRREGEIIPDEVIVDLRTNAPGSCERRRVD